MEIITCGRTDKGLVRPNNEDAFYADEKAGLLVVADGMGGHASGEIASKLALDVIKDYFKAFKEGRAALIGKFDEDYSEMAKAIGSSVRLANQAIYEAAKSNAGWQGMGTTVAAVVINRNRLSIAHVGDSRVYLVRAGDIEQLTDDHSIVYEQVKRELLTREDAQKSEMRNLLTRALGVASDVEVDVSELTLSAGDILILCTDGLNSMVSDDDILTLAASTKDPVAVCDRLVELANKQGGNDNITVIVGYIRNKSWISFLLNFMKWFRR
ncbi:MAG TPA: Stp1/IreP family PP2C-type Ser/Thr phosphatase [Syntrophales bacterium]